MTVARLPGPPKITRLAGVMSGEPCIDGTRVPAECVLACYTGGDSVADIYACYPRIPFGSIELVVEWGRENGHPVAISDRRMPLARPRERRKQARA